MLTDTPTSICNLALAELPDKAIGSLDEASIQARECNRVYAQAVSEMLERHPWQFKITRVSLANVDNDRSGEWGYAYSIPDKVGRITKVVYAQPDTSSDADFVLVGQRLAPSGGNLWDRAPAQPYLRAGSIIYTDVPDAVLEFQLGAGSEDQFPALFVKALYFDIASRICTPLSRSADRKKELIAQAELWWGRATAADLNGQMNRYDPAPEALTTLY